MCVCVCVCVCVCDLCDLCLLLQPGVVDLSQFLKDGNYLEKPPVEGEEEQEE